MSGISRAAVAAFAVFSILVAACGGGATASPTTASPAAPASPSAAPPSDVASPEPTEAASPSASGIALNQVLVQFEAQNDSGIAGGAILTDLGGGEIVVAIGVSAVGLPEAMPAHIHEGTCDDLDPTPKYPLNDVAVGTSSTVVEVEIDELLATPHAINIHKSAEEADVYVACAEITR